MQILIDECIDERLRNFLPGHNCQTARYAGMSGFKNGALHTAAEAGGFDVLLTVDHGMTYQQNLKGHKIAIVVFHAKSNRLKDLLPNVAAALVLLESIKPGQIMNVGQPDLGAALVAAHNSAHRARYLCGTRWDMQD